MKETCDLIPSSLGTKRPRCLSQVLENRLRDRGTESEESLSTRLHNAREEVEYGTTEVTILLRNTAAIAETVVSVRTYVNMERRFNALSFF